MTSTSTVKPKGQESMFVILLLTGLCSPSASDTNYYFISEKMSWRKARDYCLTQHTGLAEIHNPDNSTALMNTPNWGYRGDAWIGLRPEPLDWTWVDGEPLTQTLWEQYSSDELCAYMAASGQWRSADCSLKKYGACDTSLIQSQMTWLEAKTLCEERQTSLVTIYSPERNRQTFDDLNLANKTEAWIGLYRPLVWSWASTGENVSFTNWQTGEPDYLQASGVCATVSVKEGTWSDGPCSARGPFYCYGAYQARKTLVRIKFGSSLNIEDPVLHTRLLQQLQAATHSQRASDFKLTWTKTPKKETQGSSGEGCL